MERDLIKQIITLSDHDEKFSQTTALFEKYKIYKILKNNNNVYFIYKTNLPFSFSLAYLIDENKRNEHEIKKIEKIFDNWYYIEEHWFLTKTVLFEYKIDMNVHAYFFNNKITWITMQSSLNKLS